MPLQKLEGAHSSALKSLEGAASRIEPLVWFGRALGHCGLSQKLAALEMGITESLLSKQLSPRSTEHLSLRRMASLPVEFWRAFHVIGGGAVGVLAHDPDVIADHEVMEAFRRRLRDER